MRLENIGCVGPEGLDIALDNIVCLVGANNSGKTTVLTAYELAVAQRELRPEQYHIGSEGQPAAVELWVHIPDGAGNVDAKWKEAVDDLRLVRSRWEWPAHGGKPVRTTWDPVAQSYSENGKASGLDTVFNSRLPRPFRVGSLEDPEQEQKELMTLVLEPVVSRLRALMQDQDSALRARLTALREEAERPVAEFREDLARVEARVNQSYRRVFSASEIRLSVSLGDVSFDPAKSLRDASRVEVAEPGGQVRWSQQGTGSQRALFWSLLQVRSELKRLADERDEKARQTAKLRTDLRSKEKRRQTLKTADKLAEADAEIASLQAQVEAAESGRPAPDDREIFLPGYMLLIDEPETALHPGAVRAAKEHLYSLAGEAGWQVMLSTHHPAFVDPLKDHTTIVRLQRLESHLPPKVYRSDSVSFTPDEKKNLKALLAFDVGVAEMFFGARVIIVEGDTEFAALSEILEGDTAAYPLDQHPLVLRARGKATIPTLVKMLTHFKLDFSLLHDTDAPRTSSGTARNPAFAVNAAIAAAVGEARTAGLRVMHRCSCPNFELEHGMTLPEKDKPFACWSAVQSSDAIRARVRAVLDELMAQDVPDPQHDQRNGARYEEIVREWARDHAPADPAFMEPAHANAPTHPGDPTTAEVPEAR